MTDEHNLRLLQDEFGRIGTTFYDAFRQLVNLNAPPERQTEEGESVNVSFDADRTLQLLRSLPDGAGVQAFIDAFIKDFAPRRPPTAGPGNLGA